MDGSRPSGLLSLALSLLDILGIQNIQLFCLRNALAKVPDQHRTLNFDSADPSRPFGLSAQDTIFPRVEIALGKLRAFACMTVQCRM